MVDIWQLDKISDNNQQTWPEGTMEGNQINNAGRDDESLMARWYADWNGTLLTGGSGSAYTVSANTNRTSYGNDLVLALRIHADSLDNPTLNVSALGARPWVKNGGDQIKAGDLRTDMLVVASYRDGSFYTMSSTYLGTAASQDVGTAIGNVVQLEDVGGNAGLPAVDGSQLTGIVGPNEAKARSYITYSGSVPSSNDDFNISSIVDEGTGDVTFNLSTPFASAGYQLAGMGGATRRFVVRVAIAAGSFRCQNNNENIPGPDDANFSVVAFGSQ